MAAVRKVSPVALRRAVVRSTVASAKLENRVVPSGYVPSVEARRFVEAAKARAIRSGK
ncbi:hypothetical protein J7E25_05870 [Agromyces sp. ISL-38]|uniref:hypothetical protein n=1 Tax=Agromyces sp. ISL-38 TaxID=2819107 RepID=UPI001BE60531|nr:hypothetical protein [Agromyces sp. ISL-38]MBT2498616.1 hypothetical protein [Agromyces sp. ISL-38]